MALTTADEVSKLLGWAPAEYTKKGDQLEAYIGAAQDLIEARTGPIEVETVTHVADGGRSVTVPHRVNSVTSVTVDGTLIDAEDYTVDAAAGIIYGPFSSGRGNVTVVYTTGYVTPPAAVKLAAAMLVQHLWEVGPQRGPAVENEWTPSPIGFALPNRVKELIAPYEQMLGFA